MQCRACISYYGASSRKTPAKINYNHTPGSENHSQAVRTKFCRPVSVKRRSLETFCSERSGVRSASRSCTTTTSTIVRIARSSLKIRVAVQEDEGLLEGILALFPPLSFSSCIRNRVFSPYTGRRGGAFRPAGRDRPTSVDFVYSPPQRTLLRPRQSRAHDSPLSLSPRSRNWIARGSTMPGGWPVRGRRRCGTS